MAKEEKIGYCESCYPKELLESYPDITPEETEVFRFSKNESFMCERCHRAEGNCQNCGEYIPFPDEEELESEELMEKYHEINESKSDYAPTYCFTCFPLFRNA